MANRIEPVEDPGPRTLERMRAIRTRIENVGHALGVPEDMAVAIVQIDEKQSLRNSVDRLCDLEAKFHQFNWFKFLQKTISNIQGILKDKEVNGQD